MKLSLVLAIAAVVSAAAVPAAPEPSAVGAGFEVERYALSLSLNPAGKPVTARKRSWSRLYSRRHAVGTVTGIHLQRAMEQAADLSTVFWD